MAKTKISEFSSTPANNTDIDSINIAEGCAPSNINDAIRELMAQLKDFQTGAQGDSFNGPIGTSTAAAGAFTTLSSTGNTTLGDASGDAVTINGTATFANANPTLTAGTANGVTYLNGSKVLTSGSALTFDGTNLGVGKTPSGFTGGKLDVAGFGYFNYNATSQYVRVGAVSDSSADIYRNAGDLGYTVETGYNQRWYIGGSEGMRLTSTGLGIGTSSPSSLYSGANNLVVGGGSGGTGMTIYSGTASVGRLFFADGTSGADAYRGWVEYSHIGNDMTFGTNAATKLTLDSAGNLGLGVTPSAWATYKAFDIGYAGNGLHATGQNDLNLASNVYYNAGYKYAGSARANLLEMYNGEFYFKTAGSGTAGNAISFTQAMTLDASGRQIIGGTSAYGNSRVTLIPASTPTTASDSYSQISIGEATANSAYSFKVGYIFVGGGYAGSLQSIAGGAATNILLNADGGNVLVGTDTAVGSSRFTVNRSNAGLVSGFRTAVSSGSIDMLSFYDGDTQVCGTISINATANTTAYGTSSDYRLKQDVAPITGALEKVSALKPCTWNWVHAPEVQGQGFIAHELAEVCADAVIGEKDAVDEEGNPKYQGIDTSFLVATLTAAIQELKAEFDAYKASHP